MGIQYNVALMYFCAVICKLRSPTWLNGTAVPFTLWLAEQRRFPVPDFLLSNPWGTILTYGTTAVEILLFLQAFLPRLRRLALPLGIILHLGIEYAFNIPFFSLTVLASYLAFITFDPNDWRRVRVPKILARARELCSPP